MNGKFSPFGIFLS